MRFIADNFSEESVPIPEGFEKVQYNYKGSEIFVLKNTYEVVMIYATNIVGEEGRFYIYNEGRDILTPYTEFVLGSNVYTFLIPAEALPEGFTETSVSIGEYENVTAYAIANPDYADFVLVYAFNRTNEPGFYLYDTAEGTLQRCVDETLLGGCSPFPHRIRVSLSDTDSFAGTYPGSAEHIGTRRQNGYQYADSGCDRHLLCRSDCRCDCYNRTEAPDRTKL